MASGFKNVTDYEHNNYLSAMVLIANQMAYS